MLLLTAALFAPLFIDWDSYRADFERGAGRVLGREVRVAGEARATLLPFPSVTFTDVRVAGGPDGEPAMTVDAFSMDAELAPFLSGELLIFDMRLERPQAHITLGEDGQIDWAIRPQTRFDPSQVTLENVSITNGSVVLHQAAGHRTISLTEIDATLSARTLAGPWRLSGAMAVDDVPVDVSVSTGRAGDDGAMRLRVVMEPQQVPMVLEADGQATLERGIGLYSGTFQMRAKPRDDTTEEQRRAAEANRIAGAFELRHDELQIPDFRYATGSTTDPYTASGNAWLKLGREPSFYIAADGAQVRIGDEEGGASREDAFTLADRLDDISAFIAALPRPEIPGRIAVSLPAIVAAETTIREVEVRAVPAADGWQLESFAATLPGRTRVEASGLVRVGQKPSFDGELLLAIGQPSGFAAWLARDVDEAIRRLPSAGFSADVSLNAQRQEFSDLELILGDTRLTGAVTRLSPEDARASVSLDLEGDGLDAKGLSAFSAMFLRSDGSNRLADHDADLELVAGPVSVDGIELAEVDTALRLREDRLEVDRLSVLAQGDMRLSATGRVERLGASPSGKLDATIIAEDLSPTLSMIAQRFPENAFFQEVRQRLQDYPELFSASEIDLVAVLARSGERPGLALTANGEMGGTSFSASFSGRGGDRSLAEMEVDASVTARNADAGELFALAGLPSLQAELAGWGEVELVASGVPDEVLKTELLVRGQDLEGRVRGDASFEGDAFGYSGSMTLAAQDIEPWLATAGIVLPGFGFGLSAEFNSDVVVADGSLSLSALEGRLGDVGFGGDLTAQIEDGRPSFAGELRAEALDLAVLAEMVTGNEALQPNSDGSWPEAPFAQQVDLPFHADVLVKADRVSVAAGQQVTDATMRVGLEDAMLSLGNLTAAYADGTLSGHLDFQNNQGTGLLSAQFTLDDADLTQLSGQDEVEGRARISASVTANGKSVDALAASLSGSGSGAVDELVIKGLNPSAFGEIIAAADRQGPSISAADVAAFAPSILREESFDAGSFEFAFSVANGSVRVPPVRASASRSSLTMDAVVDIAEQRFVATGSLEYEPGREGVVGSDPLVGLVAEGALGEVSLRLETEPLAQFLTQRALEREQARVEHMQAVLLEKQRLRREVRFYQERKEERFSEEAERQRLEAEAERAKQAERLKQAREEEQRAAEEAERRAAEEAERRAEEERAAEEARQRAAEAAARQAETERQRALEAERERQSGTSETLEEGEVRRAPLDPPASDGAASPSAPFSEENLTIDGFLNLLEGGANQ